MSLTASKRWIALLCLVFSNAYALAANGAKADSNSTCPSIHQTLSEACPDLVRALDQQGLLSEFNIDTQQRADATRVQSLEALLRLHTRETNTNAIDANNLDLVRNQHYEAMAHQAPGMWQQFLAWWSSIFDGDEDQDFDASYWSQFKPSIVLARVLFVLISLAIVGMFVWFAYRELAPIWRARNRGVFDDANKHSAVNWPPTVDTHNAARALSQFYAALVRRLAELRILPKTPGLTHRELAEHAAQQDFSSLSEQAQQALFANIAVNTDTLQEFAKQADQLVRNAAQLTPSAKAKPHA